VLEREESFLPVEIAGGWLGVGKEIAEELFRGLAPGPFDSQGELKPRPPKEEEKSGPTVSSEMYPIA
jgi:hypothetical protein